MFIVQGQTFYKAAETAQSTIALFQRLITNSSLAAINIRLLRERIEFGIGVLPLSEELTKKPATELVSLIRTRAISPVEVVEAHLRRIERINSSINAIVTIADDVMDRARSCEAELISGKDIGPLHGLPVTIKDTIDTARLRTTSGSRILADNVPLDDAPAVARLKAG